MIRKILLPSLFFALLISKTLPAFALDTAYSGNFIIPENQSGFKEEAYEQQVGVKLERGAQNFFLGFLEIPHGVKSEYYYRKQEYLEPTFESFFVGVFKGLWNTVGRMGVGFFEVITFPFPQEPIVPEMEGWLY